MLFYSFHDLMQITSQKREAYFTALREGRVTYLDFDAQVGSFEHWDDYCNAVRQSSLETIHVQFEYARNRERLAQLRDAITTLESLQTVQLSVPRSAEVSLYSDAARYIEDTVQARGLRLSLGGYTPPHEIEQRRILVPLLANALSGHPNLQRVSLTCLASTSEAQAFATILPTIPNLTKVHLATCGNTLVLPEETISQILEPPTLRVLRLDECVISSLRPIANVTCRLTELVFERCRLPKEGGSLLAESLHENTSLTELRFDRCRPDTTFFSSLRNTLSHNHTLTYIQIGGARWLSGVEATELVAAVQSNYSLHHVYVSLNDYPQQIFVDCICRLNRAGRAYLAQDDGSIVDGVRVLIHVIDDLDCLFHELDCLFLHLRENPKLCKPQGVVRGSLLV